MIKSYIIDNKYIGIRIDKWVKLNIGKIPQSLIEKNLRVGKIKSPKSVDFVEKLPRQENGKLYKRLLKDHYWKKKR